MYVGLNPALAYRLNERWSLGLGVNINYTYSLSENAVNNPGSGAQDGRAEYEGDGFAFGGNISALYELNDRTRFGIVYSSEVSTDVEGEVKLSHTSCQVGLGKYCVEGGVIYGRICQSGAQATGLPRRLLDEITTIRVTVWQCSFMLGQCCRQLA